MLHPGLGLHSYCDIGMDNFVNHQRKRRQRSGTIDII
uniref:Uncharacterized protein n=1 Tax=Anguilla anguilla TaxID=7936 RepID=A0A0E9P5V1_ANGAN